MSTKYIQGFVVYTESGQETLKFYAENALKVNGHTVDIDVPSNAKFTDTVYTHPEYTAKTSGLYKVTVDDTGHVSGATLVKKADITALGIPAQDTVYEHPTSGVTAGTYKSVTVDANGHVTAGSNPTTLGGYGITDGATKTEVNNALSEAKTYTDDEIAKVFNNTSTAVDSIYELVDAMENNADAIEALKTITASKAAATDLTSHTGNSTVHITSAERTKWNAAKTHADSAHAPSGAQVNVIETVKVNGTALTPSSKAVNVVVPTKLSELENDAGYKTTDTKYTHPAYTAQTSGLYKITVDATGHISAVTAVTKSDITGLGIPSTNTTYDVATTGANGLMSSTDKTKLDGIATGANAYTHPAYTARTGVPTANQAPAFGGTFKITQPVSDATGHITAMNSRTITIPNAVATTSAAGLMSAADKTKLDGIATSANAYTHPTSGVTAGTYRSVTVNANGHVTAGSNPTVTLAQGGTGATTLDTAKKNLGIPVVIRAGMGTAPTNNGWFKLFEIPNASWGSRIINMDIYPSNAINNVFRPVSVAILLRSGGSAMYEPVIYLNQGDPAILGNFYVVQNPNSVSDSIELWYKNTNSYSELTVTVYNYHQRGSDNTLKNITIGASTTAVDAITSGKTAYCFTDASLTYNTVAGKLTGLTASRALVTNADGTVVVSAVTSTELGYLDGVTSAIQTQLNGKASESDVQDLIDQMTSALQSL